MNKELSLSPAKGNGDLGEVWDSFTAVISLSSIYETTAIEERRIMGSKKKRTLTNVISLIRPFSCHWS